MPPFAFVMIACPHGRLGATSTDIFLAIMIREALEILASATLTLSVSAQATPTVSSSVVTVSNRNYTVYAYADPATKTLCVVSLEGLNTVRGRLVECDDAGGDSRGDWTFRAYYREVMRLHAFALVASAGIANWSTHRMSPRVFPPVSVSPVRS